MKTIQKMARLCRNNPVPAILVSAIIVLLVLNFIFMGSNGLGAENRNISYFEDIIGGTHAQIAEILADSSAMEPKEIAADMNSGQKKRILMLNWLQESLKADINWLAEKENELYLQSKSANGKNAMVALANSETALLITAMQVITLNNGAIKTAFALYEDSDSVIEEAHAASGVLEVGNFYVGEEFSSILQDTALNSAEIEKGVAELMGGYLDLRKLSLETAGKVNSADAREIEFAEALKLLSLQYFMEAGLEE